MYPLRIKLRTHLHRAAYRYVRDSGSVAVKRSLVRTPIKASLRHRQGLFAPQARLVCKTDGFCLKSHQSVPFTQPCRHVSCKSIASAGIISITQWLSVCYSCRASSGTLVQNNDLPRETFTPVLPYSWMRMRISLNLSEKITWA